MFSSDFRKEGKKEIREDLFIFGPGHQYTV